VTERAPTLHLTLDGFEGPLDLLLELARAQKVDIATISIVQLVDQFLAVLEQARAVRLELAADWLVMAAWLAWLKSRLLVPEEAGPAEDPEALAAMLILIPILTPAASQFGIDPIQFGVMVVLNLIIGTVTPPVGVVLFVVTRIAEIPFETMARAILPWLIPLLAVLAAITLWPPLTTFLPRLMMGG
jgi:hypothetical protein